MLKALPLPSLVVYILKEIRFFFFIVVAAARECIKCEEKKQDAFKKLLIMKRRDNMTRAHFFLFIITSRDILRYMIWCRNQSSYCFFFFLYIDTLHCYCLCVYLYTTILLSKRFLLIGHPTSMSALLFEKKKKKYSRRQFLHILLE